MGKDNLFPCYKFKSIVPDLAHFFHIRPQVEENRASRPISRTQAPNRLVSIAVGDHARILAVVCFWNIFVYVLSGYQHLFHVPSLTLAF